MIHLLHMRRYAVEEEDHKKKNRSKMVFTFSLLFCLGFLSNYLVFSRDNNFVSTDVDQEVSIEEDLIKVTHAPEMQAMTSEEDWKENTIEISADETQVSQMDPVFSETKVHEVAEIQEVTREYREIIEGSVWTTTSGFAEELSLGRQEFWKAWKNSYAVIHGKQIHFSQVGLFQPGTKIFWDPERGVFEIEGKGLGISRELQVRLKSQPHRAAIIFTKAPKNTQDIFPIFHRKSVKNTGEKSSQHATIQ